MGGIPIDEWSGSGATKELEQTVVKLNHASEKQTKHIIKLTYAMLILTFVMACMVGVQIWLALQQPQNTKQVVNNPTPVTPQNSSLLQEDPSHLKTKKVEAH